MNTTIATLSMNEYDQLAANKKLDSSYDWVGTYHELAETVSAPLNLLQQACESDIECFDMNEPEDLQTQQMLNSIVSHIEILKAAMQRLIDKCECDQLEMVSRFKSDDCYRVRVEQSTVKKTLHTHILVVPRTDRLAY